MLHQRSRLNYRDVVLVYSSAVPIEREAILLFEVADLSL